MKKIFSLICAIIILLIFYSSFVSATWDSNVTAAYRMENNGNDDTGNYNCLNWGTPAYSSSIKHDDDYSFTSITSYYDHLKIPSSLETYLSGTTAGYTIEVWARVDSISGPYAVVWQKNGNVNATGGAWIVFSSKTGNYGTNFFVKWNGNHDYLYNVWNIDNNLTEWHHAALSYDKPNDRLTIYYDNAVVGTVNSAGDIFANNDGYESIGGTEQFSGWDATQYIDNFIISNTNKCSFPSTQNTDTPTITQTITETDTPTITQTITETDTPTITQTITETITQTITETITQTITNTPTPTMTKTITETRTKTITQTITETITKTITETVTQTITKTRTPTITPTRTPGYVYHIPTFTPTITRRATPVWHIISAIATYIETIKAVGKPTPTVTPTHT